MAAASVPASAPPATSAMAAPSATSAASANSNATLAQASGPATLPPATSSYTAPVNPPYTPARPVNSTGDPFMVMSSQTARSRSGRFKSDPLVPPPSDSVTGGTHYLPDDVVELSAGSSSIYDFPRRIRRISIADTGVADLQVVNPFQINLVGHKEGFTTLAVWDSRGQYVERQVRVDPFGRQQVMLNVIVSELNRSRMQSQGINWSFSMPRLGLSVLGLPNNLSTVNQGEPPPGAGSLIPLLLSTNVNYAVAAGNSNYQTLEFFQFLETHDLAKILAEPKLMANSGEKAEFLSGGEIPIVIAQALNTSIVFKEFGVSVIFVPTVIGRDDILLEVKPEVSEPDYANGVSMFGFIIPSFVTRRAQTFVRLKDNQMLIIAGLLLRTKTAHVSKTPYLGDIPYLGYLFKSTTYQDLNSDLVMAVTPQIVGPLPSSGQPMLPTDRPDMTADNIRTQPVYPEDATRPRF
jgi:Flp pilus assembly secretin CpaC